MIEEKRHVEKLAEARCRQYRVKGRVYESDCTEYAHTDCDNCQGTGALVPGLLMVCDVIAMNGMVEAGITYYCGTCDSPQHCSHCGFCRGRGWVLKSPAEQRVAMEDWCLNQWYLIVMGQDHLFLRPGWSNGNPQWKGQGQTVNERLAHAICQAKGIE
jgi:hypothetical protein